MPLRYGHCQTDRLTPIAVEIVKYIFVGICFRKNACFHLVDINLTTSHTPFA